MAKTILIMRHAKSSWANSGLGDHDRPLNKRGKRDAPVMGQFLVEQNLIPQRLYYSSAKRTTMTAKLLAEQFDGNATVGGDPFDSKCKESNEELYLAPWSTYVELMMRLSDGPEGAQINSIMMLGHNPGIEMLIEKLTGQSETVPTATVAWIEMASDQWKDAQHQVLNGGFRLMDIWRPKEL